MERKRDDWGMAAIQEEILDGFFNKLGNSEGIDKDLIKALRALFKSGDKLKAGRSLRRHKGGEEREHTMIQVEAVRITQLRGIRELKLTPGRKSFVVSGPNGSGKSGVVDAIQFGLTGEISRLSGTGTGGLTVQKHGPHVDRRDDPASAEVSLTLYFPELGKSAILTRNIKTAKTFTLDPDVASVRAELKEVARHPELTLSRREIIKYILVEAGERSKEIQSLLKLEMIGNIRRVLATAKNKGVAEHTTAQKDTTNAKDALRRHLDVKILSAEDVLAAVNSRRQILGLPEIIELTADKVLNGGPTKGESHPAFNKVTAVRDLAAVKDAQAEFARLGVSETAAVLTDLAVLEGDPALLEAVKQRSFVERGLALVDGPRCPLCDQEWDEDHLKSHLKTKLVKSEKAEALQERLLENAGAIAAHARRIAVLLAAIQGVADSDGPAGFSVELSQWAENLTTFAESSSTIEGVFGHKTRLEQGWGCCSSVSSGKPRNAGNGGQREARPEFLGRRPWLPDARAGSPQHLSAGETGGKTRERCSGDRKARLYNLLRCCCRTTKRPV